MVCMVGGTHFLSESLFPLLSLPDKIETYPGDSALLIFCVVTHISSALRNLAGFCNRLRSTWLSIQIQGYSPCPVKLQFLSQRLWWLLFFPRYTTVRTLPSFPDKILENTNRFLEKILPNDRLILRECDVHCRSQNAAWPVMAMTFQKIYSFKFSGYLSWLFYFCNRCQVSFPVFIIQLPHKKTTVLVNLCIFFEFVPKIFINWKYQFLYILHLPVIYYTI